MTYSNPEELLNKIVKAFKENGWDCQIADNSCKFDIILFHLNKPCGYIETFICSDLKNNNRLLNQKIENIQNCIAELKPEVFILTDGTTFENYFDGAFHSTTHIPISHREFSQRKILISYYDRFYGNKENQNDD